jgi:hypothetical protein
MWSGHVRNRWKTRHSMPSLTGKAHSGAWSASATNEWKESAKISVERASGVTDWYSSIQSVYYGRLIHLNRVCVLWQTDKRQYSLCIIANWYTSIQSVYYGRLINLNTVCVLWQTDTHQHSLCTMADWYTSIQSVCYCRLIHLNTVCVYGRQTHLNTVCVLWQTDTRQ